MAREWDAQAYDALPPRDVTARLGEPVVDYVRLEFPARRAG
jgi:hypothetical protein